MEFISSQVAHFLIAAFAVLSCGELAYKVEGLLERKVYTIGDEISLNCYHGRSSSYNYNSWSRNGTLLANVTGIFVDDPRITQSYAYYEYEYQRYRSYYGLNIANAKPVDAATYRCSDFHGNEIHSYDIKVIGCSHCNLTRHSKPNKYKVICNLDNYWTRELIQINISLGSMARSAVIKGNTFSFAIWKYESSNMNNKIFTFNPYTNARGTITCQLPTLIPSTRHPSTHYPSTSSISTQDQQKQKYNASQDATSGPPTSTIDHHTRQNKGSNKNSNQGKNLSDGDTTMIIVISGSVFILILIVLIIVLRCKQKKNHQENKHNGILTIDGKDTKENPEARYESVEDAFQKGLQKSTCNDKMKDTSDNQPNADHHGGMVENILYDSSDKIADGSISRTEGPLDNALYAMPDKRKTLDRESKSGTIAGSSAADILYGNSSIISQQGQKDNQGGDQYENIEMPGSGGGDNAEEIPLYEMPDKAPQRDTSKATPKAGQKSTMSKDEVVDVNALYAEVDKTKKI